MIHVLDWIMYFILLWVIDRLLPEDMKDELGAPAGCLVMFIYTIVYCIIFWKYDWSDLPVLIEKENIIW